LVVKDQLFLRGYSEDSGDLLADAVGAAIANLFHMADGDAFAKLLRCEPGSRPRLIKRMCGDDFHDEIARAESPGGLTSGYAGPIVPPIKIDRSTSGQSATPTNEPEEQRAGETLERKKDPVIERLEPGPAQPRARRKLVVGKIERIPIEPGVQRQPVDGSRCEELAMDFEENDACQRFPLLVAFLTGEEAPGCDVLSFETEAARAAFEKPETRDWSKVVRFIEVKGRSSATAKIELKGNEYKAALKYGTRYFLYRFYEEQTGVYLVSALRDPLSHREAIERANATERFKFVPSS
jgi:hypothetical protein